MFDDNSTGIQLFNDRLEYGRRHIFYPYGADKIHALWDFHSNLINHFNVSPRLFFYGDTGGVGKSSAMELSSLFVPNHRYEIESGAGLVREVSWFAKKNTPITLLYDEAQDLWGPNGSSPVRAMLNAYTRGGKRTIAKDNVAEGEEDWNKQELYCAAVISGLSTKKGCYVPQNFLDRCIIIDLEKKTTEETTEDFVYAEKREEVGDKYLKPILKWAATIAHESILASRDMIKQRLENLGITGRPRQLWQPMCETAYAIGGEELLGQILPLAEKWCGQSKPELSDSELMLKSLIDYFNEQSDTRKAFVYSQDLATWCNQQKDLPWPYWKGKEINPNNIADLLRPYRTKGIEPVQEGGKGKRGYYLRPAMNVAKRNLGLVVPWAEDLYRSSDSSDTLDPPYKDGLSIELASHDNFVSICGIEQF